MIRKFALMFQDNLWNLVKIDSGDLVNDKAVLVSLNVADTGVFHYWTPLMISAFASNFWRTWVLIIHLLAYFSPIAKPLSSCETKSEHWCAHCSLDERSLNIFTSRVNNHKRKCLTIAVLITIFHFALQIFTLIISVLKYDTLMGSCWSSLCTSCSALREVWRGARKGLKPQSVCECFLLPVTFSVLVFLSLMGLVGGLGICGLWCLGFGTCWGKKFLKKMAQKYDIPVDEEMSIESREVCKVKDGFVIVEMPK